MLQQNDRLTQRQLLSILFVMLLAPIIRPMPGIIVEVAGRTSWLSTLLSIIPLSLMAVFMTVMMKNRAPGEGLGEIIIRALGNIPGKAVILLYSMWFLLFTAHLFRAGSEQFVAAIYPEGRPWAFLFLMLALVTFVSHGQKKTLGRLSELIRPFMAATFIIVILLTLGDVDFKSLLPISRVDAVPTLRGALRGANVFGVFVYISFLEGYVEENEHRSREFSKILLYVILIISAFIAEVIGAFGAELSVRMNNPFFQMVGNISIMNTLERIEAVVVAIWVLSDFMLGTALLMISVDNIHKIIPVKNRLYITIFCAGLMAFLSVFIAKDSFALEQVVRKTIPVLNIIFVYGLLPIIFLIGKARKKI